MAEFDFVIGFLRDYLKAEWRRIWLVDGLLIVPRPIVVNEIRIRTPATLRDWALRTAIHSSVYLASPTGFEPVLPP